MTSSKNREAYSMWISAALVSGGALPTDEQITAAGYEVSYAPSLRINIANYALRVINETTLCLIEAFSRGRIEDHDLTIYRKYEKERIAALSTITKAKS